MQSMEGDSRWWSADTIALVTGSNKGIGLEIVKQLAEHGIRVILTARNEERGKKAVDFLKSLDLEVDFHQLDVSDPVSVATIAAWTKEKYGAIDILINNAGISPRRLEGEPYEIAKQVFETNYYGSKRVTEAFIPLMKSTHAGARIVNISSELSRFDGMNNQLKNEQLKQKLSNEETLSEEVIEALLVEFLEDLRNQRIAEKGYPKVMPDYSVSKIALNAYTRLLAKRFATLTGGHKIYVNAVCPGWVRTDLTGGNGIFDVKEGADTPVWVALQCATSGKLFDKRQEVSF